MRQWMVDVKKMCSKHLLGEHLEHHMFIGIIKRKGKLKGYLKNNLLEPLSLKKRHDEIATEMIRRGYKHKSDLEFNIYMLEYLEDDAFCRINISKAACDLFSRCSECKKD